jgi:chromosome segregation ATPase
VDERALAEVRQLASCDAELAAQAERLRELGAAAEAIRERAEEIESFFAEYPDEEQRRRAATDHARQELDRWRAELNRAREELDAARDEEKRAAAERAARRTADRVLVAEVGAARAARAEGELEHTAAALTEESLTLEARAACVAEDVPDVGPPGTGLSQLVAWASQVRASIFVAVGQLEQQRERVIREANELGTNLLGEPVYGSTTAQIRARVEAALR